MVKSYKKKPVIIEAIQWNDNYDEVKKFVGADCSLTDDVTELLIATLEDGKVTKVQHIATKGDYIIKGIKGEFYPCKPDIFQQTYEEV